MNRRTFLAASAACLAWPRVARPAANRERPNILFLLIDDQRNDTLGCAGHPIIQTPAIDELAARGVRFTNAFVTTSICAASRASIFTGLYERTHGYTFGTPPIRAAHAEASYPAQLRQAGYRTGFIGKFGVQVEGDSRAAMFDYFKPVDRNPYFKEQPDGSRRHETELAADRAAEFLADTKEGEPFCLSISFNAVHAEDGDKENPFPWPRAVDGLYDDVEIPAPRLSDPAIFESQPEFLKTSLNRKRYFWRWDTPEKYQRNMRAYYRMISGVDGAIGRIRAELARLDLDRNTIIIYLADNGYYMGDRGFAGKWSHYEQSLRVPLIVYDPRLPKARRGTTREEMALNIDVAATILELAGLTPPPGYQGRSLVPLLSSHKKRDWRKDFFCEHLMEHPDIPKWEGVRGERYVYASYFEQRPPYEFLHDLQADPDELTNLADSEKYQTILAGMRERCAALRRAYEASR
ncbi:MAG: sulfatase-like hydrolase/transferase [Nitrospiraceae bacterium]|nr:sulfatase-like hydrolase/transferase [Nitrospiraceae bacterium]